MKQPARFPLAHLPTPLEPLDRLSAVLRGPRLWIKRDDQTGLAGGGNKARKLELLIADALVQRADLVLTVGAIQSNHCRQTAAAAARAGLDCLLILRGAAPPREQWTGNLLLDDLLGARIVWAGDRDRQAVMEAIAQDERAAGRRPYLIPLGGSNVVGAAAYALAFVELWEQMQERGVAFDRILFSSSSGGTQAGLVVGAAACGYQGQLLGITNDRTSADLSAFVSPLAAEVCRFLEIAGPPPSRLIAVDDAYLGGGYGVMGDPEREAIRLLAQTEGILLDPVYTGRAMAGLLDQVRRGAIGPGETVLFWHTGGAPALFAYAQDLLRG
ncbi:MAG: D-cysteine desulfhydrase family protein [Anaerolineae bacterium]|nr:D-cysteine desulfhydrase family protein [Anaerolineae bacterium]